MDRWIVYNFSSWFLDQSQALKSFTVYEVTDPIAVESEFTEERVEPGAGEPEKPIPEKLWSSKNTLFFINLVEEHEPEFQNSIKKTVWQKVARKLSEKSKLQFTWSQCDTKWKGLQKYYKDVKEHNEKSGNSKKNWEFYSIMNHLLFKKPEINAVATCSSFSGLKTREGDEVSSPATSNPESGAQSSKQTKDFESSFMKKRKSLGNNSERHHNEKMQRMDRYLNSFDRLVSVLEKQYPDKDKKNSE